MSAFQQGYEARLNKEPKEPQGDLTLSENLSWENGWEAADRAVKDPESDVEENDSSNN